MNRLTIGAAVIMMMVSMTWNASAQIKAKVSKAVYFDHTPPLRDMPLIEPGARDRSWKDGVIRNEEEERERNDNPMPLPLGKDPLAQEFFGHRQSAGPFVNFEGVSNRNQVYPPDTDGDVGPDHYFQMINLSFQIFDKEGNSLYGPADNSTLWSGFIGSWTGTNDGDPIILYDELADRWIASQFAIFTGDNTYWELIAVSETGDPLGSWYRYAYQYPVLNDYPKIGIWPDAYYFSFNMFGSYRRVAVSAHDRAAMLAGDSTASMVLFDLPEHSEPWSMLPADLDGTPPPEGTPNYFAYIVDDAFAGGDQMVLYEFKVNWNVPDSSTFEEINRMDVAPFDSEICPAYRGRCIHQPDGGPQLESLSGRLMFRLQYRNFGDYQTMVTNHTVDVDGFGHAGIRWYELRDMNDGNGWFVYQQGTYAPDSHHRWMGSIAMDARGYIALGFSVSSTEKYPSIHYTGRSPNDPLGEMTFYEEEVIAGGGVQSGDASRWGDYSMMSVDPSVDTNFWYTTEYMERSGTVRWQTRIAGFTLVEDHIAPDAVTNLAATALTTNAVQLTWTATGDDGSEGTAFLYDIRYSTEPITAGNFENATPVENGPDPSGPGTTEVFVVNDLDFSTHYYFALKVRDRQFNFSPLSNTVDVTTPGPPELDLPETQVTQKLFSGSVAQRSFYLDNTGQSDIRYYMIKDTLSETQKYRDLGLYADESRVPDPIVEKTFRDSWENVENYSGRESGDILGVYENASQAATGMTWVNGVLFLVDMQANVLMKYDTAMQQVTDTMPIHDYPFSMAWDGEYLWIGDKVGNFYAYDVDGNPAGGSFSSPAIGYSTLTWDGEYFLTNFILENDPTVYRLDETGQVIDHYTSDIDGKTMWQITYVPQHYMGNLWMTNNTGTISQLEVSNGILTLVRQFGAPSSVSYALAHDDYDLWYAKVGGVIYRIDDGVDEINWLAISPDLDTIPASGQQEISLTFDTKDLDPGSHLASLVIFSNDQDEPELRVPLELIIVTGIDIGQDTSFCGDIPLALDPGGGFDKYLWSDGSDDQVLVTDSTGYGAGTFDIWVQVTDLGGVMVSDTVRVTFNDCASIGELDNGTRVQIFPNPNRGTFELLVEKPGKYFRIEILDLAGRKVYSREIMNGGKEKMQETIELPASVRGTYLVRMTNGQSVATGKLLIY